MKGYDYIIVGAGSAGCVLANRLSADGAARVLLIEAGPRDRHPFIHIPLGMGKMHEYGMFDWGYQTDPEPSLNGRRIEAMRGKVLGGSSSINVMAYTRGHRGDYDRWAQKGALGWSYADVLPYFKRGETWERGENPWRGGSGPIGTEFAKTSDPIYDAWLAAAKAAGMPVTDDYNGKEQEGFGRGQYTIRNGYRSSAATAYLKPARGRPNLIVETGAHACAVSTRGTRATGVEYAKARGERIVAEAGREVILCAGAFNTPPLLMRSGVGPAAHLSEMGIKPVVDLPVGRNLQDHLAVLIFFARHNESTFRRDMRFAVPDIEFMFRGAPAQTHLWFPLLRPAYPDGYAIRPTLLHPDSRGQILLRSTDPEAPPRIVYNFFSAPNDLPRLREGFRLARLAAYAPPMSAFRGKEVSPGEEVETDAEIDAFIRRTAITAHHPCGTCAMGIGPDTVTDAELRVRGIEGLRVVDASVMPDLVSAHINACVLMIAEKASDMILGKPPLPAELGA
jgi:4-pyridoxate dehydrogenase